jgi:isocitrate dehydrogenase
MAKQSIIYWTKTDEAPELATYSLLPIINAFTKSADIKVELSNISLAARIISIFPEYLTEIQRLPDHLSELGELTLKPEANIIKLPNISATIPQLKDAIKELKNKGFNLPDYPEEPKTDDEKQIQLKYSKVLGSAVNPVLREGNSDRRAAASVKKFAKLNPHKMMKPWDPNSKTQVSHMQSGDFYGNEKSVVTEKAVGFKIVLIDQAGTMTTLKDGLKSSAGEILDGTFMSKNKLTAFYAEQINEAKNKNILLSLHLKATMMKVSDPVMFGHAVKVYFKEVIEKYQNVFDQLGVNLNNGLGDLYKKIETLPVKQKDEIDADIHNTILSKCQLAMVDSDKGITNLHVPNDIIIDASMPVVIRDGGKMWGPDGKLHDTNAMIPDRCYAGIYREVIDDCNKHGAFNPAEMGSVSNVGLMAQKAEEYGSHPTTFEIPKNGTVKVITDNNEILLEHPVEEGDIWRMSRVKDIPVQDWVKLAVNRARATQSPAIFWLDEKRAHDAQVIKKVKTYLAQHDLTGLEIMIMPPVDAMHYSLERVRKGLDTISVTGNVLRDYLTDLFPIMELGTSVRMLSIVPLLAGGGLFETGAGGSAPKHVQQFHTEGHLRWDSLGEFLAFTASLEMAAEHSQNQKAAVLAGTLDKAVEMYLMNGKYPSRKAGELDNRGTHFFLAQYWAKALAEQNNDLTLKEQFTPLAKALTDQENIILNEIAEVEGKPTDTGGYYFPDDSKASAAMRPSKTLNKLIDSL